MKFLGEKQRESNGPRVAMAWLRSDREGFFSSCLGIHSKIQDRNQMLFAKTLIDAMPVALVNHLGRGEERVIFLVH